MANCIHPYQQYFGCDLASLSIPELPPLVRFSWVFAPSSRSALRIFWVGNFIGNCGMTVSMDVADPGQPAVDAEKRHHRSWRELYPRCSVNRLLSGSRRRRGLRAQLRLHMRQDLPRYTYTSKRDHRNPQQVVAAKDAPEVKMVPEDAPRETSIDPGHWVRHPPRNGYLLLACYSVLLMEEIPLYQKLYLSIRLNESLLMFYNHARNLTKIGWLLESTN